MNGMKPKFLDETTLNDFYYSNPNPYENPPACNINLLELSRYAKHAGKKLVELTKEEVQKFLI